MATKTLNINILKPTTLWVDKRRYRVLNPNISSSNRGYSEDTYSELITDRDEVECPIEDGMEIEVEHLQNGKLKTKFHVPSIYLPYLIGSKGATKNRIENDTHTVVKIPPKGVTGDIVVIGRDFRTVRQAKLKLELLVQQARKKQPFTHFLSIPLNNEIIQQKFYEFKDEVLEKFTSKRGVDASIFQDPKKLHLTLGVFTLVDDQEREAAIDGIRQYHPLLMERYILNEPIKIEIKGVSYMNDDPAEVDVLYGDVHVVSRSHNFQQLCDDLMSKLENANLATKQYERVKLHATLMNTRFRHDKDGSEYLADKKERESFDGKSILQEYKEFSFGVMEVSELHLSVRYTTAINGYYSASIKLPLLPS